MANLYPLSLAQALAAAPGQSDLASARAALVSGNAILIAPLLLGALADWAGLARSFGLIPAMILLALMMLAYAAARRRHSQGGSQGGLALPEQPSL